MGDVADQFALVYVVPSLVGDIMHDNQDVPVNGADVDFEKASVQFHTGEVLFVGLQDCSEERDQSRITGLFQQVVPGVQGGSQQFLHLLVAVDHNLVFVQQQDGFVQGGQDLACLLLFGTQVLLVFQHGRINPVQQTGNPSHAGIPEFREVDVWLVGFDRFCNHVQLLQWFGYLTGKVE